MGKGADGASLETDNVINMTFLSRPGVHLPVQWLATPQITVTPKTDANEWRPIVEHAALVSPMRRISEWLQPVL